MTSRCQDYINVVPLFVLRCHHKFRVCEEKKSNWWPCTGSTIPSTLIMFFVLDSATSSEFLKKGKKKTRVINNLVYIDFIDLRE